MANHNPKNNPEQAQQVADFTVQHFPQAGKPEVRSAQWLVHMANNPDAKSLPVIARKWYGTADINEKIGYKAADKFLTEIIGLDTSDTAPERKAKAEATRVPKSKPTPKVATPKGKIDTSGLGLPKPSAVKKAAAAKSAASQGTDTDPRGTRAVQTELKKLEDKHDSQNFKGGELQTIIRRIKELKAELQKRGANPLPTDAQTGKAASRAKSASRPTATKRTK